MTRLRDLVPNFIKPVLRPLYDVVMSSRLYRRKVTYRPKSRDELHRYWREPPDGRNLLQDYYLQGKERSQLLVKIMERYAAPNARILEIGCNVGRNLNYLFLAGFKNLEGLEISEKAVELMKQVYPEMARNTKIYTAPVEEIIREFRDCEFDVVFTMGVLEHIHKDSEWIFPEVTRITKEFLITLEDERGIHWLTFPRNYRKVFQCLGVKQIEEITGVEGLPINWFVRIFKKI